MHFSGVDLPHVLGVSSAGVNQPTIPSKTIGQVWGERIAAQRQVLGLSQAQLGELCGMTQQSISKLEAGDMVPRERRKVVIAARLGVPVGVLFAWPEIDLASVAGDL